MRLYDYLREHLGRDPKVVDFHIRAEHVQAGMLKFLIHAAYVDGPTYEFILSSTGGFTPMGEVPPTVWDDEQSKQS